MEQRKDGNAGESKIYFLQYFFMKVIIIHDLFTLQKKLKDLEISHSNDIWIKEKETMKKNFDENVKELKTLNKQCSHYIEQIEKLKKDVSNLLLTSVMQVVKIN